MIILALGLWIVLSVSCLFAMAWSLWWKRDRAVYDDRPVAEQRVEIFARAGLNPTSLGIAGEFVVNEGVDPQVRYRLRGDYNTASYIKYLLAPRVPDKSTEVQLNIDDKSARTLDPQAAFFAFDETTPLSQAGWFFSALIILGCGCLMARIAGVSAEGMGVPSIVGLGVMANGLVVMITRSLAFGFVVAGMTLTLFALFGIWACRRDLLQEIRSIHKPRLSLMDAGLMLLGFGSVWLAWRMATVVVPDDWDAWAIWGAKAKMLALGSGPLSDVTYFGHADYPLMWPAVWALSGWCSGGWEEQLARGWSAIFFGLAGWQIASTARFCGASSRQSLFAAAFFLSIPKAIVVASWSYAEPLLWLFMVLSFDRAIRYAKRHDVKDAWLGVLFGVASAYTKNEGVMFLVMMLGMLVIIAPSVNRLGVIWKSMALAGVLYGPWVVWTRFALDLNSHATSGLTLARISEIASRIPQGWQHIMAVWLDFQQWGIALILLLAGTLWSLIRGRVRDLPFVIFPILYLAGLFLVVVGHTAEIGWQVGTAWDRLTLQAIPLLIIGVFIASCREENTN